MAARIYSPAKTAMQSGKGKTGYWIVEFEPEEAKVIDPLTGYTGSGDMKSQLRLRFDSREDAVAYAERHGLAYRVETANEPRRRPMAYSDNFKFDRIGTWTH